ncbi:trypsin-like cysteine/serine peptidase domain-containing protein [Haematococcus lacustris]
MYDAFSPASFASALSCSQVDAQSSAQDNSPFRRQPAGVSTSPMRPSQLLQLLRLQQACNLTQPVPILVMMAERQRPTRAASVLPFLAGCSFGALGLAAWERASDPASHPFSSPHLISSSLAALATTVSGAHSPPSHSSYPALHTTSSRGWLQRVVSSSSDLLPTSSLATQQHLLPPPMTPSSVALHTASASQSSLMSALSLRPSLSSGQGPGPGSPSAPLTRDSVSLACSRAEPAVVQLVVSDGSGTQRSSGSGWIYHEDGFIITNTHCLSDLLAAQPSGSSGGSSQASLPTPAPDVPQLFVTLADGRVLPGSVLCTDKTADLAVVKVDAGEQLPTIAVGRSADLRIGEWVVALGVPLQLKHCSVTLGVVSALRTGLELGLEGACTSYIQTDAAINQGSSGGPLINLDGQVVGVSVFKAVGAEAVSFCLPIDAVREVVQQFSQSGRMVHAFVGLKLVEVPNGACKQLQQLIPQLAHSKAAVVVQTVKKGSPAEVAGLLAGDIILAVEGTQHLRLAEVVSALRGRVNKATQVRVVRRDAQAEIYSDITLSVTPAEAPDA